MSRVEHIAHWSVQDWRTSRVRARAAITGDPVLSLIYLELCFALYESGGELPADPEVLADVVMLPAAEVARCLPLLAQLGRTGRGGIVITDGILTNARVTEDLEERRLYRETQAKNGKLGGRPRKRKRLPSEKPTANPSLSDGKPIDNPPPSPPTPFPSPLPPPLPSPSRTPTESCGAPVPAAPPVASTAARVVTWLPIAGKIPEHPRRGPIRKLPDGSFEYGVTEDRVAEWAELFPGVDVPQELGRMRLWCRENRSRRKTYPAENAGVLDFIATWLGREQNKARGGPRPLSRDERRLRELQAGGHGSYGSAAPAVERAPLALTEAGRKLLDQVRKEGISGEEFALWFGPLGSAERGADLVLIAPNTRFLHTLEESYRSAINRAAHELSIPAVLVEVAAEEAA